MPYTPVCGIEILVHRQMYSFDQPPKDCSYWEEHVKVVALMAEAWYIRPQTDYDRYGKVFGYPSTGYSDSGSTEHLAPLAKNRGLPDDMDVLLRSNYEGCGNTQGETWISWHELQALDLAEIRRTTGKEVLQEWWILFEIMTTFARYHGDDKVRLVAWWSK